MSYVIWASIVVLVWFVLAAIYDLGRRRGMNETLDRIADCFADPAVNSKMLGLALADRVHAAPSLAEVERLRSELPRSISYEPPDWNR